MVLTSMSPSITMPVSSPTLACCYDVACDILSHLDPPDVDYTSGDNNIYIARHPYRRTLLSLALCCRAFLDPSLDKLWHSLDGVYPLLKLLPNYQRHNSAYVSVQEFFTMDVPVSDMPVCPALASILQERSHPRHGRDCRCTLPVCGVWGSDLVLILWTGGPSSTDAKGLRFSPT